MNSEHTTGDFDPESATADLVGTWRYPRAEDPTGFGLSHFAADGLYIDFVFDPQHPGKRIPMRLRYSVESPTQLRVRPKNNKEGWLLDYRFEGAALILFGKGPTFVCTRVLPEEIPEWFHTSLESAHARSW